MSIYSLDFLALRELMESWNVPPYRAQQIWDGLYRQTLGAWPTFTTLPGSLRERLQHEFDLPGMHPVRQLSSSDGHTEKTAFRLKDGFTVETTLMRYARRATVCVSSQAGCAMGCTFCATGQMGFGRNLSSGEIVAQAMHYSRVLRDQDRKLTNIVFMGMGEPFHNYKNSMMAIRRLNDASGFNLGARHMTISTVGLPSMIRRFADEGLQVNLAVSLHAAEDRLRGSMLPVNRKHGLDEVLAACRYYVAKTRRRISFEWALIQNVNDAPEHARQLAARVKGLLCHVNAIPLNPTNGYEGSGSSGTRAARFRSELERLGVPCTVRLRRGIDIAAGCGQLGGVV
jgi:23S rRNA (adenine2503-C2)-methyltransferase